MVDENNIKNATLVKIEENTDESVQPALIIDAELPGKTAAFYRLKWIIFAFLSLGALKISHFFLPWRTGLASRHTLNGFTLIYFMLTGSVQGHGLALSLVVLG